MSVLIVLLIMWGVVASIYSVLFFPEIVRTLHRAGKTARWSRLHPAHDWKHWGRHASHTA
jgi:hypothetical protein